MSDGDDPGRDGGRQRARRRERGGRRAASRRASTPRTSTRTSSSPSTTPPAPSWPSPGAGTAPSPASTGARPASTSSASGGSGSASRPLIIVLGILSIVLRGGLNLGIEFKGGTEWTIAAPGVTQTQAVNAMKGTGRDRPHGRSCSARGASRRSTSSPTSTGCRRPSRTPSAQNVQKALLEVTAAHAPKSPPTTTTTAKATTTTTTTAARRRPRPRPPRPRRHRRTPSQDGRPTRSASPPSARPGARPSPTRPSRRSSSSSSWWPIYISIRFEPKMALAAFIAMIHDVLVAVGIYSIFNFQVTPDTVVAILTILGLLALRHRRGVRPRPRQHAGASAAAGA